MIFYKNNIIGHYFALLFLCITSFSLSSPLLQTRCVLCIQNMIKNIKKYWGIYIILHSNCILSFIIIILRRGLCRMLKKDKKKKNHSKSGMHVIIIDTPILFFYLPITCKLAAVFKTLLFLLSFQYNLPRIIIIGFLIDSDLCVLIPGHIGFRESFKCTQKGLVRALMDGSSFIELSSCYS